MANRFCRLMSIQIVAVQLRRAEGEIAKCLIASVASYPRASTNACSPVGIRDLEAKLLTTNSARLRSPPPANNVVPAAEWGLIVGKLL